MIVVMALDMLVMVGCITALNSRPMSHRQQNRAFVLGIVALACYAYVGLRA